MDFPITVLGVWVFMIMAFPMPYVNFWSILPNCDMDIGKHLIILQYATIGTNSSLKYSCTEHTFDIKWLYIKISGTTIKNCTDICDFILLK